MFYGNDFKELFNTIWNTAKNGCYLCVVLRKCLFFFVKLLHCFIKLLHWLSISKCPGLTFMLSGLFTDLFHGAYRWHGPSANVTRALQGWRNLMSWQLQTWVELLLLPVPDIAGQWTVFGLHSWCFGDRWMWLMVLLHICWPWLIATVVCLSRCKIMWTLFFFICFNNGASIVSSPGVNSTFTDVLSFKPHSPGDSACIEFVN